MKKKQSAKTKKLDLNAECDFRNLPADEMETACKYEYMRESQALRDELKSSQDDATRASRSRYVLPLFAHENMSLGERYRLVYALRKAGFPKPWKLLRKDAREKLTTAISEWETERKRSHPPVVIEPGSPEPDEELNYGPDRPDDRTYWRLKPSELELLRGCEQSGRKYFFGSIRIDEAYNESEAVKAFRTWFRERWEKTKGGGGPKWRQRLMHLALMRIWKHERDQWERLKLVAEFCGYKGCVKEAAEHKDRCKGGHGNEPMSDAAKVEMSSARRDARQFFQRLFPREKPLSYQASHDREKVKSNQKSSRS